MLKPKEKVRVNHKCVPKRKGLVMVFKPTERRLVKVKDSHDKDLTEVTGSNMVRKKTGTS